MRKRSLIALLAIASVLLLAMDPFQGLVLSTPYPSMIVPLGDTISLSLQASNHGLPPQIVSLEVRQAPEGWQAFFLGGGKVVRSIYLDSDQNRSLTLRLEPPQGVTEGTYEFEVALAGDGVEAVLPLEVTLGDVIPVQLTLEAELPVLKGGPDSSFNFQTTLRNESDQDQLVTFEIEAPPGFQVTPKKGVGGQEITSLPVSANGSERVTFAVRPPLDVAAGEYPLHIRAVADEASVGIGLTAAITGEAKLKVTGQEGRLSSRATLGKETPLTFIIENNGTAAAEGLHFESNAPAGWEITFSPENIASIEPDSQAEVTATIKPAEKALAGDYVITLRAISQNSGRASEDFRITLVTSTQWGVVGLALIAAALGVVAVAVARFGRR